MNIIHKAKNSFASSRYLYFFSDRPHLMKTTRNAFYKSGSPYGSRYMWNNGLDILWSYFSYFYFQDLDIGLHLLPKITRDHVVLNSYSKMNVCFSNQVLSHTVPSVIRAYGLPDFSETVQNNGLIFWLHQCSQSHWASRKEKAIPSAKHFSR